MGYLSNGYKHFCTVTKHRHQVLVHCLKVGIGGQGLVHDLSKFSPVEFMGGVKFYKGTNSPNEGERAEYGYSKAWLHHKGRNRHHFEYWCDYNPVEKKIMPVKMPINYVKEMFCDRVAASKVYQGKNYVNTHPLEYFKRGRNNRNIHPETSELIEEWLTILATKGEKETFKVIKNTKNY